MATGRDRNEAHRAAVAALGKVLTRRAGSACELCGPEGVDLRVVEVPPTGEAPDPDTAILACGRCRSLLDGRVAPQNPETLRFLEGMAWSGVAPVQIAAVRLLRRIDASWAAECLDGLWIAEPVQARLDP